MVAIVAIRLVDVQAGWALVLALVALLFALALPLVLLVRRKTTAQPFTVVAIRDESSQVPVYLLTYIFPFAFAPADSVAVLISYLFFGLLLVILLVRTDLGLVNPILLAAGIHIFVVRGQRDRSITLIAKSAPLVGSSILAHPISGNAFVFSHVATGDNHGQ
ncbi:MAG: hypothetical protein JWQ64_2294 [Subtercola sp.]|nr:hypothetical protein [Subtercola sp.]